MSSFKWVRARMLRTNHAATSLGKATGSLNRRLSVLLCSHIEWKFVNFAMSLRDSGMDVTVVGNTPSTTKQECVDFLISNEVEVFSPIGLTEEEVNKMHREIATRSFDLIFDDGCHVIPHLAYPERILSATEYTMSGVNKLKNLSSAPQFPVFDLNSSYTKEIIGNEYGTGASALAAFQTITNVAVSGLKVGIVGYGPVGKGVASAFKGAGGITYVQEIDLRRAMKAELDGHRVLPVGEIARVCDFVITCTGQKNVLSNDNLINAKNGVILANVGHFGYEIDMDFLKSNSKEVNQLDSQITEYDLKSNRKIYVLCDGALLNLSGGLGFPIEIIDFSFAAAINAWKLSIEKKYPMGINTFPNEADHLSLLNSVAVNQL